MRIIHLLQSSQFSGAENVVCQIINMMEQNDNIEMAYCSRDGKIREALVERNILFFPISNLTVKEVKKIIKEYNPDIIHAHDMRASFVAIRASKKIPVISHIHNNSFASRGISLKSVAFLYAAMFSKKIFWVSDSAFNGYVFRKLINKKSEVLYNILDIEKLKLKMNKDKQSYQYDIVYLGRLTIPKNPHRLLTVLKKIIDKNPNIRIAIIGTGELEKEVHEEAAMLNIESNVDFLGFLSNPYKILHDAKVMLMTSLWEGTPMCVLEAMSLGVPVVSTPTDGVSAVVMDGETGYLTDDDEELASNCLAIVDSDELHDSMSRKSIIRAEKLLDKIYYKKRLLEAYNICVQEKRV